MIFTGLFTLVTTVLVTFIGIVPQLRSGDARRSDQRYDQLRHEFDVIKQQAVAAISTHPPVDKRMSIKGTLYSASNKKRKLNGMEVYVMPEGNNLLTAKADDSGQFEFKGLPPGTYSIIVRDPLDGRSGRAYLNESGGEVDVFGASVKYQIHE
jgi:hypothetical protein